VYLSLDDAEQLLERQEAFPARLLFVSSKESASILVLICGMNYMAQAMKQT
jgi:hypothetical protein